MKIVDVRRRPITQDAYYIGREIQKLGFAWLDEPMDDEGFVHASDRPGLGQDINRDYIRDNIISPGSFDSSMRGRT